MILTFGRIAKAAAFAAALALWSPGAQAQEISESHLQAAYEAVSAVRATEQFDEILPGAAQALRAELIQKDPNLVQVINATVDEQALAIAGRRADLEREAALAYARVFSEQELTEMATFYNSPTGKKLLSDGPIVTREVLKAVEIWQNGIARDLAQAVGEKIGAVVGNNQAQPGVNTPVVTPPAEGAAPAEGEAQQEGQANQ